MNTSAWSIHKCWYFGVTQISRPALLLEFLTSNIGVSSLVSLLSSQYNKGNLYLGAFGHLEKVVIMSVWLVL